MDVKKFADEMIEAVKGYVVRQLAPHEDRIARLEKRLAELEAAHAATVETQSKVAEYGTSLERRASRHADHLARLESRVKAIETK